MAGLLIPLVTDVAAQAQSPTYVVVHNFTLGQDGANPIIGFIMDRAGTSTPRHPPTGDVSQRGTLGN